MKRLIPILMIAAAAASCQTGTVTVRPGDDLAEAVARSRTKGSPVTIRLKEGTYNLTAPLVLTPEDSGLCITGAGMGKTVISGGRELPPFTVQEDGTWVSDLSSVMPLGADIQQLFVGGKRATLARTPNDGELFLTQPLEEFFPGKEYENWSSNGASLVKCRLPEEAAGALDSVNPASTQFKISFLHAWDITRRNVLAWSPKDSSLVVPGKPQKPWNHMDRCSQFFLEDDLAFMDAPGEYFYDIAQRQLHYIPLEGQEAGKVCAILPYAENLLVVKGDEAAHVKDVAVRGVTLAYTAHEMSWRGEEPQQASFGSSATVLADFADNLRIENCEVSHTGNSAVWFRTGCRGGLLSSCLLEDLGVGGVKIGEYTHRTDEDTYLTRDVTVDNNIMRHGSRVMPTGVGVILFDASDCHITHNEVADFYYSGMSVGWQWGYMHSASKRNIIEYNHIHHIGWGVLSDMGGVYTLGKSEGTHVDHNVIHDIYSLGYGGWGLYTDEGSTGITMAYNLVYNCKSSAFHQHYGRENHILNNIFAGQIRAQMEATRIEEHKSFDFARNIICYSQGNMYGMQWGKVKSDCHDNLYWCYSGEVCFNGLDLEAWKEQTGWDTGSIVADPGFTSPSTSDFTIRDSSAVRRIGFEPFDWTEAGVYGDEAWKKLAQTDPVMAARFAATVEKYESRQLSDW